MASEDFIDLRSSCDLVIVCEENKVKEDCIDVRSSTDFVIESEQSEVNINLSKPSETNTQGQSSPLKEDIINEENSDQGKEDGEIEDGQHVQDMELDDNLGHKPLVSHEGFNLGDTINKVEKANGVSLDLNSGSGCIIAQNNHSTISNHGGDETPISGVKRPRMTYVYQEPSVHFVYTSLTSASKRKLEELLQQWCQWHAQQKFLYNDPNESLESGEQTLFPALHFGLEKASTVSFWMDNQTRKEQDKFIPLDGDSVPMYDRGFALGLTLDDGSTNMEGVPETLEASRCFNCGSYSHSLRDCQKPRDNAAVDNARKQHSSKRTQIAGSRNSSRYYEDSPGGKYDGIRPGVLGSEIKQLMGLGELDPPPWLHRMREIGYPLGYLDLDYEDQPSGITIYADEETKDGEENGEILDTNNAEPKKKMTVEFPGINAPIPENADERRWASLPEVPSFDLSRIRSQPIPIPYRSSETTDKGNYSEPRRPRDHSDDGPPGCNTGFDSQRYSGYAPNFASDSYSPRGHPTPVFGRSLSDRGRWSPLVLNGSPSSSPYSPVSYASPSTLQSLQSPQRYNTESRAYSSQHKSSNDSSSQRNDRHDHRRHRRI